MISNMACATNLGLLQQGGNVGKPDVFVHGRGQRRGPVKALDRLPGGTKKGRVTSVGA